ncbi:(2Fe-2S)-binding protein [Methylobacterium planeticum]|uniref:(2Fe-2S)-binding protein n=1 Tax=Methylobacterium planeticum TaxID=2615211 RepID=A0A6N6MI24_9HYPH|nr:(2Fe-2S)-binding protein [Methylobacterium planeticum]KAB1069565.1 (2Fe-2S)-binding protein [Methylobacterium planeticum]
MLTFTINGAPHQAEVEGDTPLLFVLRDSLGLTGTKYGCGIGQCGACTVLLDGQATRSCQVPAESVGTQAITTIEAIEADPVGRRVVAAWIGNQVAQCGYCQSGQVMAATSLLKQSPKPSDDEIAGAMTNLCRCGTYNAIAAAVRQAAA